MAGSVLGSSSGGVGLTDVVNYTNSTGATRLLYVRVSHGSGTNAGYALSLKY